MSCDWAVDSSEEDRNEGTTWGSRCFSRGYKVSQLEACGDDIVETESETKRGTNHFARAQPTERPIGVLLRPHSNRCRPMPIQPLWPTGTLMLDPSPPQARPHPFDPGRKLLHAPTFALLRRLGEERAFDSEPREVHVLEPF